MAKDNNPDYTPPAEMKQDKIRKRKQLFFASDVLECADYVEYVAEKFEYPSEFMQAVIKKLTLFISERQ